MRLLTLEGDAVASLSDALAAAAVRAGLTNVFNPSVVVLDGATYVSFRAEATPGAKPFGAYLLVLRSGEEAELENLADAPEGVTLSKVADPKLVLLGRELYVTFNTGNVHAGENDIYLRRVAPSRGPLQRCVYPARRPVEKNWGFYPGPDGVLRALYSLAPYSVLRLSGGELGVTEELRFDGEQSSVLLGEFPRVHIGSQPLVRQPDRALVVANQQVKIPKIPRKIYLGRLVEIDLRSGGVRRSGRSLMMHSWRSMVPPQRDRHNPMLWSATYFSGLSELEGELLLGYGVNDRTFGVARVPESSIWR